MQISEKPPEVLQAQVAAFAEAKLPHEERGALLANVGDVALRSSDNVPMTVTNPDAYSWQRQHKIADDGERASIIVAKSEYTNFLRESGGSQDEGIKERAEILKSYDGFKPEVDSLKQNLPAKEELDGHPDFVGMGVGSRAFAIEHNGEKYVVRFPWYEYGAAGEIDSRIAGAIRAKDVPHLEQVVAASYDEGVVISEYMPGTPMDRLDTESATHITKEQISELVDTLIEVQKRGILLDPMPGNLLYDSKNGFNLIDFSAAKSDVGIDTVVRKTGEVMGRASVPPQNREYVRRLFKEAISEKLQGEEREKNIQAIESNQYT